MRNLKHKRIPGLLLAAVLLGLSACGAGAAAQDEGGSADLALLAALNAGVNAPSITQGNELSTLPGYWVKAERVRYCKNTFCTRATTPSRFQEWEQENVDRGKQRETYIAVVSEPPRGSVENVVFLSAGQQTTLDGNGYNNVVTGQPEKYKKNCKGKTASCWRQIDGRSLARHIINSGKFPLSKTLFVLVFDARFNYEISKNEKNKIENAYYRWLTNRVYSHKLKRFYLAGQSRGGCLAFRLGKRLRAHSSYRNVPMILQGYDAVCDKGEGELGTTKTKYGNPYNSNHHGFYTNLSGQFPHKTNLGIRMVVGGGAVVPVLGVHAFVYTRGNTGQGGWHEQTWVNLDHSEMGREYSKSPYTIDPGLNHMHRSLARFP
ncbi:MAG: hypothetical protein NXI24_16255 [bacterium]|nr:hypothetical protein [bacterium]